VDPVLNPYTPNAGAQPPAVVGRDDLMTSFRVLLARLSAGRTSQSMIITGLRGVGKTVLLNNFRKEASSSGWVVIEAEVTKHDDDAFRRNVAGWVRTALFELSPRARWTERLQKAGAVLKSFSVSVDPAGALTAGIDVDAWAGLADRGDLQHDLTDLLVSVGEAAQDRGRGVVLLFDEVQFMNAPQLEALISALHKTVQRELPITMVGAGLPQIAELAGDAKSYAERLFQFPAIENLNPPDARRALEQPAAEEGVAFDSSALDLAVELTGGYPYFLQELGYGVWDLADGPTISVEDVRAAEPLYQFKLDASFFRVRLDRTTELERVYLRAMAELGSDAQKAADVAQVMDRDSTQVAPIRAKLISMGLLYTPRHGYAAFTVPHFDRFMHRAVPDLIVPEVKRRRKKPGTA
jgi:hypothetical protein